MDPTTIQAILSLINAGIPAVGGLIVAIKGTSGQVSIGVLLSSADANFDATIKSTSEWLAAHPAPASTTKPA